MVTSFALSLPVLTSPPPLTCALFVTLLGALAAIETVREIEGKLEFGPRMSLRVQLTVKTEQLQPMPVIAVAVSSGGKVSLMETVPFVDPVPLLRTVSV